MNKMVQSYFLLSSHKSLLAGPRVATTPVSGALPVKTCFFSTVISTQHLYLAS